MAVPKRRSSKTSKRNRRSHHRTKNVTVNECPNCQSPIKPHHVCPSCGHYKGREVIAK